MLVLLKMKKINSIKLNIDIDLGEKAKLKKFHLLVKKIFKDKKLIRNYNCPKNINFGNLFLIKFI